MRYAVVIKPDNNKNTSRELPSIVADGAGNERLSLQVSNRNHCDRGSSGTYRHRLISTASLGLAITTFPLHGISVNAVLRIRSSTD